MVSRKRSTLIISWVTCCTLLLLQKPSAQACCGGSGLYALPRLQLHELALSAVTLRAAGTLGSLNPSGKYIVAPGGTGEVDLRQTLTGIVRLFQRGQLGINLPFVETRRSAQKFSDFGGGIGDVSLSVRYDFTSAGQSVPLPGVAIVALINAPSGSPPENSRSTLLVDVTGTGTWQGALGLGLEYAWRAWIASANITAVGSLPRKVGQIDETMGLQCTALLGLAYLFASNTALSLTVTTSQRFDAIHNGVRVAGSGQGIVTLVFSGTLPINRHVRVQSSLFNDMPALGRNTSVTIGGSFVLIYALL